VYAPDLQGRRDILNLYLSKVKTEDKLDVDKLARGTTGFTGADLENLVNQAALKAAMDLAPAVAPNHLEFARDKVMMGEYWLSSSDTRFEALATILNTNIIQIRECRGLLQDIGLSCPNRQVKTAMKEFL
jgi:ATP-dependent Zn protease